MIRICIWLPPIAASVPAKQRKEKKEKKKIAVAHSVQRNFARFEVGGWKSANGRRHRRHAVALADGFSLPLSLSLSSTPSDYPRILSRSPWSDPTPDRRKKVGSGEAISLSHTKFNNGESIRDSRGGEKEGARLRSEKRNWKWRDSELSENLVNLLIRDNGGNGIHGNIASLLSKVQRWRRGR